MAINVGSAFAYAFLTTLGTNGGMGIPKERIGRWSGRGPEMSRANAWGWCQMRLLLFSTIGVLDSDHSWQPLASGGTNG